MNNKGDELYNMCFIFYCVTLLLHCYRCVLLYVFVIRLRFQVVGSGRGIIIIIKGNKIRA